MSPAPRKLKIPRCFKSSGMDYSCSQGLEILWGLLRSCKPLLALEVQLHSPWFHFPPISVYFHCLLAMGQGGLWSGDALMLSPGSCVSGSKSLLAEIWLHHIITVRLGKTGQHVGSSVSLQLCTSWTSMQSPNGWTCASCICRKGRDAAWKRTDLVNLAMIIQEVCGRAANKIQTFCLLGLCLHNNTVLPLGIWACCLIGMRCSACLLKGKECWESHALIQQRKWHHLQRKTL